MKRQWVSITSVSEMVVPVIGMHSSGECVEIIDFAAPVPLHHRVLTLCVNYILYHYEIIRFVTLLGHHILLYHMVITCGVANCVF